MVFGLWSLIFGLWPLVFGLWSLVFGLWSLVFGLRSLVFSLWSLVIGFIFWIVNHKKLQTTCNMRSATKFLFLSCDLHFDIFLLELYYWQRSGYQTPISTNVNTLMGDGGAEGLFRQLFNEGMSIYHVFCIVNFLKTCNMQNPANYLQHANLCFILTNSFWCIFRVMMEFFLRTTTTMNQLAGRWRNGRVVKVVATRRLPIGSLDGAAQWIHLVLGHPICQRFNDAIFLSLFCPWCDVVWWCCLFCFDVMLWCILHLSLIILYLISGNDHS